MTTDNDDDCLKTKRVLLAVIIYCTSYDRTVDDGESEVIVGLREIKKKKKLRTTFLRIISLLLFLFIVILFQTNTVFYVIDIKRDASKRVFTAVHHVTRTIFCVLIGKIDFRQI